MVVPPFGSRVDCNVGSLDTYVSDDPRPFPLPGGHIHLPYSIQKVCERVPPVPHEEREDSVLILAKQTGASKRDSHSAHCRLL